MEETRTIAPSVKTSPTRSTLSGNPSSIARRSFKSSKIVNFKIRKRSTNAKLASMSTSAELTRKGSKSRDSVKSTGTISKVLDQVRDRTARITGLGREAAMPTGMTRKGHGGAG